ncbi:MAG: bifunctional chorismate mutase/prephenate dehydratase [Lachnospiraceae bacterium]|nr:bifunctional chorismate mutase/prephenate dehydratase [Lachnospiraceae bacterium]MBO7601061.1 bifunctional chorismate mutase/prephenate dehydratase [Lachnospiraceae bacterium]
MNIPECREKIDAIDKELLRLFTERMGISKEIAAYKKENNIPTLDLKREREKMLSVFNASSDEMIDYAPVFFSIILELSRSYQNKLNGARSDLTERIENAIETTDKLFPERADVACQGVEGANSQLATDKLFRNPNIMYFASFEAVFSAIEKGLCKYGVIPVENSTAGSVNSVYDLMLKHHFSIVRSIRLKIEHNLLANEGTKLSDIKEIYSHEQAISQCSEFLSTLKGVKIIPCENTAVAAKMVAESKRNDVAALSSLMCMKYYGLSCVKDSVQNQDNNYTRFICIAKQLEIYPGANRTSIMLTLSHEPGALYKILSRLYALGINLNKLESRPLPNREFEFMFYFDLDAPVYSPKLIQLMAELPGACESFNYLGSYSEII